MGSSKPFYQSKAFWFNVLAGIVLATQYFGYTEFVIDPQIEAAIIAGVNLVLRAMTNKGIALK